MGTVRSAMSFIVSKGSRSSSLRRKCSITAASRSSFFRRGVTLGEGMEEETWLSMFSNTMLRTWLVLLGPPSLLVSPGTRGERLLSPP